MTRQIEQTKNDFVVYRALGNEELHNAIMERDIEKVELIVIELQVQHGKNYDFLLFDQETVLDIDLVKAEIEEGYKEYELELCRRGNID